MNIQLDVLNATTNEIVYTENTTLTKAELLSWEPERDLVRKVLSRWLNKERQLSTIFIVRLT